MTAPDIRLRFMSPGLLLLPWDRPLAQWSVPDVPLRDIAVGVSRNLVKFVETDGDVWAVKQLSVESAEREYRVLRRLQELELPAVRPAGVVRQAGGRALLVTRYLSGSWQYRRLFMRLPLDEPKHRARLLDAMASLMVELHRHGIFWGDCSLANTLFCRDGQVLQAQLVDAETSEIHAALSDGQRGYDLDILVENVAAGFFDICERLGQSEMADGLIAEARGIRRRYERLWAILHDEPVVGYSDRFHIDGKIRQLNDLGFAVEELTLNPVEGSADDLRVRVAVGDRRLHSNRLLRLTGLEAGEGQARILIGDIQGYQAQLCMEFGQDVDESTAARLWMTEVAMRGMHVAHEAVGGRGSAVQAYCDLLEIRWLLSERAGRDVGTDVALAALSREGAPEGSAARLAVIETPTSPLPIVEIDTDGA
ncbi:hypothetical protein TPAU25S_03174 [Tsukamurella paurometabola]|uniref:DUF4032 domain-containing protein n=1 Tax=Tsukamurella paurometabola (strain ATCC 8368 / DSM 20162 / CCUG 35730 / CIP 100753 / JCM 10117 / KCTC 9821 / NBRC 16120 / NCIMB 702349 / NCTC 13040) TaxID=521096 RepID=D5UYF4_TSUPD|nr:DUF4032 domain-containing protein [Tsukamurella paurometabola]ADG78261.1 conserved hypothetical protein [Tsukamurella paurometabola DSM 20162]SUP30918.1 Lipopolysaccharide kinase (Kdo/WaaP) family [Tsukamurella paurometabola]